MDGVSVDSDEVSEEAESAVEDTAVSDDEVWALSAAEDTAVLSEADALSAVWEVLAASLPDDANAAAGIIVPIIITAIRSAIVFFISCLIVPSPFSASFYWNHLPASG